MNDNTEYKASYKDLEAGSNDIVKTVNSINESINNANKIVSDIHTEPIFYGPIADYCQNTWNKIQNITINNTANLTDSSKTLNNVSNNYQSSDTKTGDEITEGKGGDTVKNGDAAKGGNTTNSENSAEEGLYVEAKESKSDKNDSSPDSKDDRGTEVDLDDNLQPFVEN